MPVQIEERGNPYAEFLKFSRILDREQEKNFCDVIYRLSEIRVDELLDKIHKRGTTIDVHSIVHACRVPDEDLFSLKTFGKTKIVMLSDVETMPRF